MSKNIFLKIITLILILSSFSLSFFEVSRVHAQGSYSTGADYRTGGTGTGGISGYIQLISPAIQELPLCKDKILTSKVKGLFRGVSGVLNKFGVVSEAPNDILSNPFQNISESILVTDKNTTEELKNLGAQNKEIQKSVSSLEENDTCLKSIGRIVIKILLQKITFSTVEWINNGFEGKPLFLEDPGEFFKDIATNELLMFRAELSDPTLYPFAKNFLQQTVRSVNNRFAQNARFSANELIQRTTPDYNVTTFRGDFGLGGWNAWNALTQVPANNPIGFQVIATQELSFRLEGTSASTAQRKQQDLDQAEGFLGVDRCVADPSITRAEHRAALERNEQEMESYEVEIPDDNDNYDGPSTPTFITRQRPTGVVIGACPGNKWEYVTPGKAASEALTKVLSYPDNNLLKADDLNAAIAAILDAAMNKFIPELLNQGLSKITTEGRGGSYLIDSNNRTQGAVSRVDLDFPASLIRSSWLKENSDFDIRTDLTQALIDEQRIYRERLITQNRILDDLITTVHQLDYCIPGPNPNWEIEAERKLVEAQSIIPSRSLEYFKEIDEGVIEGAIKQWYSFITLGISDRLINFLQGVTGKKPEDKRHKYYGAILQSYTNIEVRNNPSFLEGKQDITNSLDIIFSRYAQLIKKHYTRDFLPDIAPSAAVEFFKIAGYQEKVRANDYSVSTLDSIVSRLATLKTNIDALNPDTNTYQDYLPYINEFARISSSMVTGNDISNTINETTNYEKQIKYVYDDLLKGPFGCERGLSKIADASLIKDKYFSKEADEEEIEVIQNKLRQTRRAPYPHKIWYEYTTAENPHVVELDKYGVNKVASPSSSFYLGTTLGPGFLSGVELKKCKDQAGDKAVSCIDLTDLFYDIEQIGKDKLREATVGLTSDQPDIAFEKLIRVY